MSPVIRPLSRGVRVLHFNLRLLPVRACVRTTCVRGVPRVSGLDWGGSLQYRNPMSLHPRISAVNPTLRSSFSTTSLLPAQYHTNSEDNELRSVPLGDFGCLGEVASDAHSPCDIWN